MYWVAEWFWWVLDRGSRKAWIEAVDHGCPGNRQDVIRQRYVAGRPPQSAVRQSPASGALRSAIWVSISLTLRFPLTCETGIVVSTKAEGELLPIKH